MIKCQACGTDKDMEAREVYPFPDDGITDSPIEPIFTLDCEDAKNFLFRTAKVCHACFHKLNPDLWISRRCWESLNPVTNFDDLPIAL